MGFLVQAYHTSSAPAVCMACHSMGASGSTWLVSNHKQFACVECHMPASGTVPRVIYKMRAGLHDLWHETLKNYPVTLTLSPEAGTIINDNCLRCHKSTVERIAVPKAGANSCTRCHRRTMHHRSKKMEE